MQGLETRRGRPRKFAGPSRAVTLTLPEHVIEALGLVDLDLSRAIVRLTPRHTAQSSRPAELSRFGRHAIIVINPTRTLAKRTGVELVPLPDGRALISFAQSTTIAELELLLDDALADQHLSSDDKAIFESIVGILRKARRSTDVTLLQRSIIVLENRRPSARRRKR